MGALASACALSTATASLPGAEPEPTSAAAQAETHSKAEPEPEQAKPSSCAPLAAVRSCLYGDDYERCEEDDELLAAVDAQRDEAQAEASEGSFAAAHGLSAKRFARELETESQSAVVLDDFVHPDIGVFVFRPYGWELSHHTRWPAIPEAAPAIELDTLLHASKLRTGYSEEVDDLGCAYALDAVVDAGGPGGLPEYFNADHGLVEDEYRLCSLEAFEEHYDDSLSELEFRRMQRAALAARGETQHAASLGLFAEGFGAKTCSTPGTAAFWLRALDENSGARRRAGFHHGLLAAIGLEARASVFDKLERRINAIYWSDGLLDLFAGLGVLAIGLAWLVDLVDLVALVALGPVAPALLVPL